MWKIYAGWLLLIIGTLIAGYLLRGRTSGRWLLRGSYTFFLLLLLEGAGILFYHYWTGVWTFDGQENYNSDFFSAHPYLVATPTENVQLSWYNRIITHNSQGFRGPEPETLAPSQRIAAIGGSTTYGVGVTDNETWPYLLDSLMPASTEVLNFGVPGHSSVEHVIFSAFQLPQYRPDVVLIHAGINDLRNLFVKGLEPDYANFHEPNLRLGLGQCYLNRVPSSGLLKSGVVLMQELGWYPVCSYHAHQKDWEATPTREALAYFERNIESMVALIQSQGATPVLVPQVLKTGAFEGGQLTWWIPFVEEKEIENRLGEFNAVLKRVADRHGLIYVQAIDDHPWEAADFTDPSHFNGAANRIFAGYIQEALTSRNDEEN